MKAWIVVTLLLAVCGVALLAQSNQAGTRPTQAGRFQIVVNPAARADTFLLDTASGHIWQRTKYTDLPGQPEVWQIQDRVDSQLDLVAWAADHQPKPPAPPVPDVAQPLPDASSAPPPQER